MCVCVCFLNRIMEYQRKYKCYYFLLSGKAQKKQDVVKCLIKICTLFEDKRGEEE